MCRADATVTTMFWRDGLPTSRAYSDHECVDWNVFDDWARSRMMDMSNPEILVCLLIPQHHGYGGYRSYSDWSDKYYRTRPVDGISLVSLTDLSSYAITQRS